MIMGQKGKMGHQKASIFTLIILSPNNLSILPNSADKPPPLPKNDFQTDKKEANMDFLL